MLRILLGTNQRVITRELLRRVCRGAAEHVPGHILLVPEQYSHDMERALCEMGGDRISRFAEVLSFTRLAVRVSAQCGGISQGALDKGGRLLAMSLALETVGSQLKLYGTSRKKPEFLLRLLSVLEELKAACITAQQLKRAAQMASGQLAVKLEELSLILESFETVCASLGRDANDRLALLREQLEESGWARRRCFYICGFSDFTGQELSVLSVLLADAEEVVVGLLSDGTGDGAFSLTEETRRTLLRLAAGCGGSTERLAPEEDLPEELRHLSAHLMSGPAAPWPKETARVALHHSAGVYGACMDAAGRIRRQTAAGRRYRELAVCCTQPEVYRPVLESVFERFDIPVYFSGAEPIESDPVIGMLLAALDAATGGMEAEDVLRFLKSGLSPVLPEDCDQLENYAKTWRIRGRKWESDWDMHPGGYGLPVDDAVRETLARLNQIRAAAIVPLTALRAGLRDAPDTAAQAAAFYQFLETISLPRRLQEMQTRSTGEEDLQQAQAYGQMYEIVVEALEQLHRVLGRTVRAPEDFAAMLAAVLSQYTLGTIPASLDSVHVGDCAAMRFTGCKTVFVLGAEDGLFPPYRAERGIFSEGERRQLQSLGLGVAPGQALLLDRELSVIHQVMTSAGEGIYVNYCTEQPSYLFTRLCQLFPRVCVGEDAAIPEILFSSAEAVGELAASQPALLRLNHDVVRRRAKTIARQASYTLGPLDREGVRSLYGDTLRLSASRIDRFAACRCGYFLHYGLKLKPCREASFDAPVFGAFVHAVLEETARRVTAEGGFRAVPEARLEEIAGAVIAGYHDDTLDVMLERSERMAYLYRRNLDEVLQIVLELGRELRCSDFEPAGFEVEFSAGGQMPPVSVRGAHCAAELSGFVDRVDLYTSDGTTYVRVVDYKTGKRAFDYTDVLNGMGLQMLIYLFALEEHGQAAFGRRLRPAGVLYFPARRSILTATGKLPPFLAEEKRQNERTREGILSDAAVPLAAMERFEKNPVYMPYKVNAKGELVGDLAGGEDFERLRQHVKRSLARMADGIASGQVAPNPITRGGDWSACTWCDYAQVCHQTSGEVESRPMKKTDRKDFWERLKREEGDHG